jgi:hypothetical protein
MPTDRPQHASIRAETPRVHSHGRRCGPLGKAHGSPARRAAPKASGAALNALAPAYPAPVGGSADLTSSTNTARSRSRRDQGSRRAGCPQSDRIGAMMISALKMIAEAIGC